MSIHMWGMVFVEALLWSPFVFPDAGGLFSFHGPVLGRSLRGLRRAALADAQADFAAAHAAGIFLRPAADFHSRLRVVRNSGAGGVAGGYSRSDDIDLCSTPNGCRQPTAGPGPLPCS